MVHIGQHQLQGLSRQKYGRQSQGEHFTSIIYVAEYYLTSHRRGLIGNFAMGVIPMIFYGIVNLIALIAETGLRIVTGRPAAM